MSTKCYIIATKTTKTTKMFKTINYVIPVFFLIIFTNINAQEINSNTENIDTSNISILSSRNTSIVQSQNIYSLESELTHQKLLRNIFAASFLFLFAALMFVIFYYGSKVRKINELISAQNNYMNSTKDQLQKIISVFNHIDRSVFITNSKGVIEWTNTLANKKIGGSYENSEINLLNKFSSENQGKVFQSINNKITAEFNDTVFENISKWRVIPIENSKDKFSNMVFIGF